MSIVIGSVTIDGETLSRNLEGGGKLVYPYVSSDENALKDALKFINASPDEIAQIIALVLE